MRGRRNLRAAYDHQYRRWYAWLGSHEENVLANNRSQTLAKPDALALTLLHILHK